MEFFRIKHHTNNTTEDVIVRVAKMPYVSKYYPNKLNPNQDFEILFNVGGELYRIPFNDKEKADYYFDYVMEKLRSIELKNTPW